MNSNYSYYNFSEPYYSNNTYRYDNASDYNSTANYSEYFHSEPYYSNNTYRYDNASDNNSTANYSEYFHSFATKMYTDY